MAAIQWAASWVVGVASQLVKAASVATKVDGMTEIMANIKTKTLITITVLVQIAQIASAKVKEISNAVEIRAVAIHRAVKWIVAESNA